MEEMTIKVEPIPTWFKIVLWIYGIWQLFFGALSYLGVGLLLGFAKDETWAGASIALFFAFAAVYNLTMAYSCFKMKKWLLPAIGIQLFVPLLASLVIDATNKLSSEANNLSLGALITLAIFAYALLKRESFEGEYFELVPLSLLVISLIGLYTTLFFAV